VRDDKGCVAIGVFGVPGHSFIDNAARAMRATHNIINHLRQETGMECSAGIATGSVFCGLVGADFRVEWAVMGPSVNLSARLMGKAPPGRIMIDGETQMYCAEVFLNKISLCHYNHTRTHTHTHDISMCSEP